MVEIESRAIRSRNLRYRKPALADMGLENIRDKLVEISDDCQEISWYMTDDDLILNALDGDEEEEFEFKMMFSMLSAETDQLLGMLNDYSFDADEYFDDCTVGLLGNIFNTVGYDDYEEDYFSLTNYDQELAYTTSGKKLMRLKKEDMIATIGRCVGILLSFNNVQMKYEYLKATFDILKGENNSILKTIKEIESAYEAACDDLFSRTSECKKFDALLKTLPEKFWVE